MSASPLPPIATVGILAKPHLHAAATHLTEIESWLASRGVQPIIESDTASLMPASTTRLTATKTSLATSVDIVLVLGGDGTLLGMADCIGEAGADIPMLGVNFGSLGFLTEVTLPELYPALEAALSGRGYIEERVMLQSTVRRAGGTMARRIAVNDAVVTKAARSRMVDLSVWVDDDFVTRVKADGLIVATPTGSTAYNLAAGGPIVQPNVEALVLTPIAPHTLTNRPVVVPATSTVRVQPMMDGRDEVYVTFDGQVAYQLEAGDEILVRRADVRLRLLRPTTRSYYQVLRTKLKWGER
ncbi:MAG: NAD(+)/NADH kinase [Vicinamibacterales bacterium]